MVERTIGRFGGLDLGIRSDRGEETPNLYLAGACLYDVPPYQTGPALVGALLELLDSIPAQLAKGKAELATRHKRLADLRLELERSFEHESRLIDLLGRQRRLLRQLDLDKDQPGTAGTDADEVRRVA